MFVSILRGRPAGARAVATCGLLSLATLPAWSQSASSADQPAAAPAPIDALQEIVVTAEKSVRASAQTSVGSIVALSGDDLLLNGQTTVDSALKDIPGVMVTPGVVGGGFDVSVRGVGPTLPASLGGGGGVSVNFDGIYDAATADSGLGFYDVDRIELLLGPQGTLYGRNAEGGVLNVVTHDPNQNYEGSGSLEVGNYNLLHITGMLNLPLGSDLALRVAGASIDRRGFYNDGLSDDVEQSGRIKLLYTPSDNTRILLGTEYFHIGGEGPGTSTVFGTTAPSPSVVFSNPAPKSTLTDQPGYKVWAQLDQDLGFAHLTVLPAYQHLGESQGTSPTTSTTGASYIGTDGAWVQRSVEARLASETSSSIKWLTGVFYYDSPNSTEVTNTLVENGNYVIVPGTPEYHMFYKSLSKGVFGQATAPITEQLRVIAGLRGSQDEKQQYSDQYPPYAVLHTGEFHSVDYKAGLEYDLTADSMLYTTYATGYRPGGINQSPPDVPYYDEHLKSLEIGSKNEFLDHRLRVNGDVYWYDYHGYQVQDLTISIDPVTHEPNFSLQIPNLPQVTNIGGELGLQYRATANDQIILNLTTLHSRIGGNPAADVVEGFSFYGKALPQAPRFTLNFTPQHVFHLPNGAALTASPDVRYSTSTIVSINFVPAFDDLVQPAYWAEDFTMAYTPPTDRWSASAYIRNISNQMIKGEVLGTGAYMLAPRVYGVVFSAKF